MAAQVIEFGFRRWLVAVDVVEHPQRAETVCFPVAAAQPT